MHKIKLGTRVRIRNLNSNIGSRNDARDLNTANIPAVEAMHSKFKNIIIQIIKYVNELSTYCSKIYTYVMITLTTSTKELDQKQIFRVLGNSMKKKEQPNNYEVFIVENRMVSKRVVQDYCHK